MVDYKIVDKYLGENRVLFNNVAKSFVSSYSNFKELALEALKKHDTNFLYREIHSQKGISLNLGLKTVYNYSVKILPSLRENIINDKMIIKYIKIFDKALIELKASISSLR